LLYQVGLPRYFKLRLHGQTNIKSPLIFFPFFLCHLDILPLLLQVNTGPLAQKKNNDVRLSCNFKLIIH
jgi:hypothetical protein